MVQQKDIDPYANPRAFYATELKRLREEAGLTQAELADKVFCSGPYIGQMEQMIRAPQVEQSELMDEALGSKGLLRRLAKLARQSRVADYFADAAALEQYAKQISEYAPVLVPGLMQTEEYARAVTRTSMPFASEERIEELVQARMDRQQVLNAPRGPVIWEILYAAVLRAPVGGPEVMHRQLLHLTEAARQPKVIIQVLPFGATAEAFMDCMLSIMSFSDMPTAVYVEGGGSGTLIEDETLVEHNMRTYDLVRAAALSPAASLALIESSAKDYVHP